MNAHDLPVVNASLNGIAGILLFLGWKAIKRRDQVTHRKFMIAAMVCSSLFLCSYVTYHALIHGVTRYQGHGILRMIYFTILLTHTPLAIIIVPFAIRAFWLASKGDYARHVKITRWLMPVWMYVSVTGVLIYLMLYVFKPSGV